MAKTTLILFLSCIIVGKYALLSAENEWAEYEKSEKTDSSKDNQWPLQDLFYQLRQRVAESWERAQHYNNFEQDWQTLKLMPFSPTVLGSFLGNTTMPAIYTVAKSVKQGWIIIYKIIMDFTKQKCNKLIGPDAPTHPWNLIKQNRETVSFVVFVYAVGLGLILIRLCSLFTFMGIAAGFYTTYTLGGPYVCFRWFVFITGCGWFLLDKLLTYPLQSAVICLLIFLWSNLTSYFDSVDNMRNQRAEYKQLKGKVDKLDQRFSDLINKFESLQELVTDHADET